MEYFVTSPLLDLVILTVLMLIFARHEADWEPGGSRSAMFFTLLNPKVAIIFWPQCVLCRLLVGGDLIPPIVALLIFVLPLAPLLYRFCYVPWRKAFTIAGSMGAYMTLITIALRNLD